MEFKKKIRGFALFMMLLVIPMQFLWYHLEINNMVVRFCFSTSILFFAGVIFQWTLDSELLDFFLILSQGDTNKAMKYSYYYKNTMWIYVVMAVIFLITGVLSLI